MYKRQAQGGNKYDYATTRDIPLNLDYARRGSKALFEIYAQNPVNAVDLSLIHILPVKNINQRDSF